VIKVVPLKTFIFAWRLILNHVPTKNNLVQRRILALNDQNCSANCGMNEDKDHLFVKCDFVLVDFRLLFLAGFDSQNHPMKTYWITYFTLEG